MDTVNLFVMTGATAEEKLHAKMKKHSKRARYYAASHFQRGESLLERVK